MARRGLVQGQRRQVVERAAGQVVGVDPVGVRTATTGGPERRDVRRHRHDGEASARQGADQLADLPVHPLGNPRRAIQQFLWRLGVEPRIAAQEGEEGGEVAFELHVLDDVVHLGADRGDFLQAYRMDLVRGQVQRGVFAICSRYQASPSGIASAASVVRASGCIRYGRTPAVSRTRAPLRRGLRHGLRHAAFPARRPGSWPASCGRGRRSWRRQCPSAPPPSRSSHRAHPVPRAAPRNHALSPARMFATCWSK